MKKGMIFDLDGVLVFTDHFHYLAWKKLADRLNIEFNESMNNQLRGISRLDTSELILKERSTDYSEAEKRKLAEEKNGYYREFLQQMSPLDVSDEVRNILRWLKGRGYQLAVGSSSKNAPFILQRTQLSGYFDAVADGKHITRSNPDQEVFLKAAEYLGLSPFDCAVVEDARAGIQAAKAGGMTAIAMGDAVGANEADYTLDSLSDLPALITKMEHSFKTSMQSPF